MVKALKAVDEDILTGPHISMMTVTPTMAKTWLEKNTARNRKVVPGLILKYVEDIRAGRWQMNGSTIVMSTAGTIIDGQHRLRAIVEANRAIETMVASGIEESAFETIDSGRRRTAADVLSILGYTNVTEMAAVANMSLAWEKYRRLENPGGAAGVGSTTQEVVARCNRDSEMFLDAIRKSQPLRKVFGGGAVWSWYWIVLGRFDGSDRDFFFERLADGQGLMLGDPVYALRQVLFNARANHRQMPRMQMGGLIVKAWNKYRNHERIQILSFSAVEDYPEPI